LVEPDVHQSGRLLAGRIRTQSDIWKFPVGGSPADNTRGRTRITRQTGQAQTPSVSPNGAEVVYLSDSGGHGNLWIATMDGSSVRQLTFERDPGASECRCGRRPATGVRWSLLTRGNPRPG
jgi:hypothetical protein